MGATCLQALYDPISRCCSMVLAAPARPLDETCDRALHALLLERRSDGVALLPARTQTLGADQVDSWEPAPTPRLSLMRVS